MNPRCRCASAESPGDCPADRAKLEEIVADRNSPRKWCWRAEIVLCTADGLGTNAIMRRTGKSKPCVWRWQERVERGDEIAYSAVAARGADDDLIVDGERRGCDPCVGLAEHHVRFPHDLAGLLVSRHDPRRRIG